MKKRIISLLLAIALSIALAATGYAEGAMPYSDTHFQSYGIALSTSDIGDLYIVFSVQAKVTSDIVGVMYYDVLQEIDGEWVEVAENLDGYLKSDTVSCTFSKIYDEAVSGERYRIYAKLYVKKYDGTARTIDYWSQSYTLE